MDDEIREQHKKVLVDYKKLVGNWQLKEADQQVSFLG